MKMEIVMNNEQCDCCNKYLEDNEITFGCYECNKPGMEYCNNAVGYCILHCPCDECIEYRKITWR